MLMFKEKNEIYRTNSYNLLNDNLNYFKIYVNIKTDKDKKGLIFNENTFSRKCYKDLWRKNTI